MSYRRRQSPLHTARPLAAVCWFVALIVAVLTQSNPLVLGAVWAAILLSGAGALVWAQMRRALLFALGLGIAVCLINALVVRDGLTVIWRFGQIPLFGNVNVTLEATVYGAIAGARAAALVLVGVLYSLCVDPDAVLRSLRRISFAAALSAAVATRMVPVLMRDGRGLADAQRCRAGAQPSRLAILQATTAGVLDRALALAATLEVRGYSLASDGERSGSGSSARSRSRLRYSGAWSRHDWEFTGSAAVLVVLSVGGKIGGVAPFSAYPTLHAPLDGGVIALAVALVLVALAPFADRRGLVGLASGREIRGERGLVKDGGREIRDER